VQYMTTTIIIIAHLYKVYFIILNIITIKILILTNFPLSLIFLKNILLHSLKKKLTLHLFHLYFAYTLAYVYHRLLLYNQQKKIPDNQAHFLPSVLVIFMMYTSQSLQNFQSHIHRATLFEFFLITFSYLNQKSIIRTMFIFINFIYKAFANINICVIILHIERRCLNENILQKII
jgi:hypothetical protein